MALKSTQSNITLIYHPDLTKEARNHQINIAMAASSLMAVEVAIAQSRCESSVGKFADALHILASMNERSGSTNAVHGEIVRIHIILGNHAAIALSIVTPVIEQGNDPYDDLLFIQMELSCVSTGGELAHSLQSATLLFKKYLSVLDSEDSDDVGLRILYYCLEIKYFWKLYGDGIPDPQIEYDGRFLQQLILGLTRKGLHFEALELLEHFVEDGERPLEAMAYSLQAEDNLVSTACLIRLAMIRGRNGDAEYVEETLDLLDKLLSDDHQIAKIQCDLIVQRFLEIELSPSDRIERLIGLSGTLLELGDFNTALQALEYAAEIQCTLFGSAQNTKLAVRINTSLQAVCEQNNDQLSRILFQFRSCDVINSMTGDLSSAISERNALLSTPLCAKLPYLQSFHRRQWAEYFLLHQRENALHHADIYLDYCRKYKSREEYSNAEIMRTQTIIQPVRMSEEARESLLEGVRKQLEQGIKTDKSNRWYLAQVEKQLLLVEVLEELGRLQEEEPEETARLVAEILDDTVAACNRVEWKRDNMYMKFEIILLREAAFAFSKGLSAGTIEGPENSLSEAKDSTNSMRPQESFHKVQYFQQLVFAIRNKSLPSFERLFKQVCQYMNTLKTDENSLKHAELLAFRGMIYYFLLEFDSIEIRQFWRIAGFKSMTEGANIALKCFEQACDLKDETGKEVIDRSQSADVITTLAAGQAYFTNTLELLIIDIALELAFGLKDKNQTWDWIQRSKARGLSKMMKDSLVSDSLQNGPDYLELSKRLNFTDLQWIQTASARKIVFVDWISFGTSPPRLHFFSFSMDRNETGPIAACEMVEIGTPIEDLKEAARKITGARMDDSDASRYLQPFIPVIQPLANYSKPGDILLLSLTAPLHAVPLHAVPLNSDVLIKRNPIVYVLSQSALLSCLQRLSAPKQGAEASTTWRAAVFGAYDDGSTDHDTAAERSQIYSCLEDLAQKLGTEALLGTKLTKTTLERPSPPINLLHFHGHGISDIHSPARQSLALGLPNEILTMPNMVALNMHATHVTLIACSSGVQDFSLSGDEPLGLLSSFLLGGASSVIGALWPIQSSTGRLFTRIFYDYFLHHIDRTELGPIVNLAMAIQYTVLEMRELPGTRTPYHWAPFLLYGAWFCSRKPGSW